MLPTAQRLHSSEGCADSARAASASLSPTCTNCPGPKLLGPCRKSTLVSHTTATHTCHQLLNINGSLQLDPLQLIFQDELVRLMDVLGARWLGQKVVLQRQGRCQLECGTVQGCLSSHTAPELPGRGTHGWTETSDEPPGACICSCLLYATTLSSNGTVLHERGFPGPLLPTVPPLSCFSPHCSLRCREHANMTWLPTPGGSYSSAQHPPSPSPTSNLLLDTPCKCACNYCPGKSVALFEWGLAETVLILFPRNSRLAQTWLPREAEEETGLF